MNILKPKPNPQQLLRDWQRRLRQECRNMERQIRGRFFTYNHTGFVCVREFLFLVYFFFLFKFLPHFCLFWF